MSYVLVILACMSYVLVILGRRDECRGEPGIFARSAMTTSRSRMEVTA
jgi:hypothetical protein